MPGHPHKMYDKTRIDPRVPNDFYPTPRVATELLLKHMQFEGTIWEPMSGNGAISRVLEETHSSVKSSDIHPNGYGQGGVDFLQCTDVVDHIITNPAYSILDAALSHALKLARHKVAFLINIHSLYGLGKFTFYKNHRPSEVLVLSRSLPYFKDGKWKAGGSKHAWLIFDKENTSNTTQVHWALHVGRMLTDYDRELTLPDAECLPDPSTPEEGETDAMPV